MNAYVVYVDEAAQDLSLRWSMYTVPGVDSMTHDDRTASLCSGAREQQTLTVSYAIAGFGFNRTAADSSFTADAAGTDGAAGNGT